VKNKRMCAVLFLLFIMNVDSRGNGIRFSGGYQYTWYPAYNSSGSWSFGGDFHGVKPLHSLFNLEAEFLFKPEQKTYFAIGIGYVLSPKSEYYHYYISSDNPVSNTRTVETELIQSHKIESAFVTLNIYHTVMITKKWKVFLAAGPSCYFGSRVYFDYSELYNDYIVSDYSDSFHWHYACSSELRSGGWGGQCISGITYCLNSRFAADLRIQYRYVKINQFSGTLLKNDGAYQAWLVSGNGFFGPSDYSSTPSGTVDFGGVNIEIGIRYYFKL